MWRKGEKLMETLNERIKHLRKEKGLTQNQLADVLGVTDKAVSTWENGSADPRMGAVQKMADYFGIKGYEKYKKKR